jgi:hypothetical protein
MDPQDTILVECDCGKQIEMRRRHEPPEVWKVKTNYCPFCPDYEEKALGDFYEETYLYKPELDNSTQS